MLKEGIVKNQLVSKYGITPQFLENDSCIFGINGATTTCYLDIHE